MLELWSCAYAYDDPYVAGLTSFLCFAFCFALMLMLTLSCEPGFKSFGTGKSYRIKDRMSCTSRNFLYLISCTKCNLQNVGSTSTQFKVRFRNHKSAMIPKKKSCETAIHFNQTPHDLREFNVICIEMIRDDFDVDNKLLAREAYWAAQLRTLNPDGLNKM